MVDTVRCGKIGALDIDGRVPLASALSPLFVAFGAGEGACAGRAAGAAVFGWVRVAFLRVSWGGCWKGKSWGGS